MERHIYLLEKSPVLKRLVLRLTASERRNMEQDVIFRGGSKSVRVWGKVILVDYEYYDCCHKHNVPFCLSHVYIENEMQAIAWVCRDQLQRKSLPEEMRKYLIGKQALAEREIAINKLAKLDEQQSVTTLRLAKHNVRLQIIRERIGAEHKIVPNTVAKYESYAKVLDNIGVLSPEFVEEHLTGMLKVSLHRMEAFSVLPPEEKYQQCQRWLSEPEEVKLGKKKRLHLFVPPIENKGLPSSVVSIKDMPDYDPDAEIVSLVLTIPTWRSSIKRVKESVNIMDVSMEARLRLIEALMLLQSMADKLIDVLKEG